MTERMGFRGAGATGGLNWRRVASHPTSHSKKARDFPSLCRCCAVMRALLPAALILSALACGRSAGSQLSSATLAATADTVRAPRSADSTTVLRGGSGAARDAQTDSLMARISALSADSMEGRLAGSPGGVRARKWIERELQSIGVPPLGASYEQRVVLGKHDGADTLGANIIARIAGKHSSAPVIVLSAHYDHLGVRGGEIYNGADDDASGCVALLAIAERLKASGLGHDVLLVFFDGEESDLVGAHAFVAAPPLPLGRIAIDINLDMVSRQDGGALWVAGLSHYLFLEPLVDAAMRSALIPIRLGHDTRSLRPSDDWTDASDHGAFHDKKIPFLYLGVEDHVDYHKPGDDANKIKPEFYAGAVKFAEALLRAVDAGVDRFPAR